MVDLRSQGKEKLTDHHRCPLFLQETVPYIRIIRAGSLDLEIPAFFHVFEADG